MTSEQERRQQRPSAAIEGPALGLVVAVGDVLVEQPGQLVVVLHARAARRRNRDGPAVGARSP